MTKRITVLVLVLVIFAIFLCGCNKNKNQGQQGSTNTPGDQSGNNQQSSITNDESSHGENIKDLGAYDGLFDGKTVDIDVKCVSGTPGAYRMEGNVLVFTAIDQDSVYSVSGNLFGAIMINIGDNYNFELEFSGFALVADERNPITVLSGNEVTIQAKKNTKNYIYDLRKAIGDEDSASISAAIYSDVDMEISGKGSLAVVSENNNGIHSKKDLQVKNLDLIVSCKDNALKGNDTVEMENATARLIATAGDCIKTSNSDISNKGNQRGTVLFNGGSYQLYAACDGIDSAYDVIVNTDSTSLTIYTDKYSSYSENKVSVDEGVYYIGYTASNFKYSVKYYNSDENYEWVNADFHGSQSLADGTNHFYSFTKKDGYAKMKIFVYSSTMEQGQEEKYTVCSDFLTPSDTYDTIVLTTRDGKFYYNWTDYSIDADSQSKDSSAKGIKASNEVIINAGSVSIKSYDDGIHARNTEVLENGAAAKGDITLNGGSLSVYTGDNGLHADGKITVKGGSLDILNSYEGIEAGSFTLSAGSVSLVSKDDGINGTNTSGSAISISGGTLYVYAGGDGIDSNSRDSYSGISFSGGKTVIISTSAGNSSIDTEQGYSYTGGSVVAIMPRGGMSGEASNCQNFDSVGRSFSVSVNRGSYLVCQIGSDKLTVNMPADISGAVVILGSNSATASVGSSSHTLSEGEFIWE